MARRRHQHEEHTNHEAWAIPYGDLVTLLLAFFVVMYALSSVNEGKYRVLSDSLVAAFRGQPHTWAPIQVGEKIVKVKPDDTLAGIRPGQAMKFINSPNTGQAESPPKPEEDEALQVQLREMSTDLEDAMQPLIDKNLIRIHRAPSWVEVEIRTDILFPSGSAEMEAAAVPILERVAGILAKRRYPVRVEGHTDNVPIRTAQFPSNWELSAARASRIVRLFQERGIAPVRLVVAGMGENQPVSDNTTAEGRNRNRRVALVILGATPAANDPKPAGEAVAEPGSSAAAVTTAPLDAIPPAPPGGEPAAPADVLAAPAEVAG